MLVECTILPLIDTIIICGKTPCCDTSVCFVTCRLFLSHCARNFCQTASTVLNEPSYNNKIKLSSAGLIYCHFGHQVLRILLPEIKQDGIVQIFKKIYDTLIVEIDAIDNGLLTCESVPL